MSITVFPEYQPKTSVFYVIPFFVELTPVRSRNENHIYHLPPTVAQWQKALRAETLQLLDNEGISCKFCVIKR